MPGGNVVTPFVDYWNKAFKWRENQETKLWTRRYVAADFTASAHSKIVDITNFRAAAIIEGAFLLLEQNFAGGGAGSATFSAGTTGSATAYINAANVFTGAAANDPIPLTGVTLVPGTFMNATHPIQSATLRLTLACDVNTSLLTTGILDIFLRLRFVAIRPSAT
jgi:hypothetical protein